MFTPTVNFDTVAKHFKNIYNWMKPRKILLNVIFFNPYTLVRSSLKLNIQDIN